MYVFILLLILISPLLHKDTKNGSVLSDYQQTFPIFMIKFNYVLHLFFNYSRVPCHCGVNCVFSAPDNDVYTAVVK